MHFLKVGGPPTRAGGNLAGALLTVEDSHVEIGSGIFAKSRESMAAKKPRLVKS
jgi:hypothetical protein